MLAAHGKHLPLVRGADPNLADVRGRTALHCASFKGNFEIADGDGHGDSLTLDHRCGGGH